MTRTPISKPSPPTLDEALEVWGQTDLFHVSAGDEAALQRIYAHADAIADAKPRKTRHWWVAGGLAVAASVALAVLLTPEQHRVQPIGRGDASVQLATVESETAFLLLYSPTGEEEYQL